MREAPALRVIKRLLDEGSEVIAYDPAAMPKAKDLFPAVSYVDSAMDAMAGADAAVFLTEWDEFRALEPSAMREALKFPIVADGRNLFRPEAMREAGITYLSMGRALVRP
jgi:UDPglucose 6-dehydrogenase